jgi:putative SOS response-associated peptidase YedK
MTLRTGPSELARIFDAELRDPDALAELGPRYNIAPTQPLTVVVQRDEGRFIELHRWGLVPAWSAAATSSGRLINARAETITHSPAFRVAFRRRRCLVPADGFYEWLRDGRRRMPYLIQPRDGRPLAFAGVWAPWRDRATGDWLLSAAVVTTRANATVGRLHDRMPVILGAEDWSTWLDPTITDAGLLEQLLEPVPDGVLELVPVSPLVNSPHNEGPSLIERVTETSAAPTLFSAVTGRG